jgi:hypothetical protein
MDFMAKLRAYSQGMNKQTHKILFHALLFCVYVVFFSVESFYNFEGQPQDKAVFRYSVVKSTPLHSSTCHGFRLNKRYHPEVISPCPVVSPEAPKWRHIPVRLGSPGDRLLPDLAIIHYSLRGPPAAA